MALDFSTLRKPINRQVIDPATGLIREEWDLYFKQLTARMNGAVSELSSQLGDVFGPASAVDGNLASFDGTDGDTIQDSGIAAADVLQTGDIGSTVQAQSANLDNWAGEAVADYLDAAGIAASFQPLDADLTEIAALGTAAFGRGLLTYASEAAFKAGVNLEIGVDVQGFDAETAKTNAQQEWSAQQNFDGATLSDGPNISWNLDTQQVARVTLGGNRILDNPSNIRDGSTYLLEIVQGAGGQTLTFDTAYYFPGGTAPALSTGAGAIDLLCCKGTGTKLLCNLAKNFQQLPPSGAFLQQTSQTGAASTFTFNSQNLGAAHAERTIVVAINADTTPASISSLSIGGVAATQVVALQDTNEFAAIFIATVPSGTTGTIVVTFNTNATDCSIALFRFVGLNSNTATATANNVDDPAASTINVSANGFVVGCATFDNDTTAVTTVGVTENYDADMGSSRCVGGLFSATAAETGRTVSFDGGATNAAGVWAAFR